MVYGYDGDLEAFDSKVGVQHLVWDCKVALTMCCSLLFCIAYTWTWTKP